LRHFGKRREERVRVVVLTICRKILLRANGLFIEASVALQQCGCNLLASK
jgi:hypothetical protein